jgi:O-acetyl-ADP-ribose deacetylase (regulator of RNase III)
MRTIKGDLIKLAEQGEFNMIVQGCNCFHVQGSGLAGQLATKYPQVLEADKEQSHYGDKEKLGTWSVANIGNFSVINAYTQYSFSRGNDVFEYDAFDKFLNDFRNMIEYFLNDFRNMIEYYDSVANFEWKPDGNDFRVRDFERFRIGFPQIGAGLAGGDWSRISKMIEKFSEDVASYADVTVVEYQP